MMGKEMKSFKFYFKLAIILILPLMLSSLDWVEAKDRKPGNEREGWTVRPEAVQVFPDDKDFLGKKLVFAKGAQTYEYLPAKPPYILIPPVEKISIGASEYFVTYWLSGQLNWTVRVFSPETKQANILCEFLTEADESQPRQAVLRANGSAVEVRRKTDIDMVEEWILCNASAN